HLLRLDMSFHKTRTPGEMIQRIDGDIDALSTFFSQFVLSVLGNLLLMAGVLALLFVEDWRVGLGMSLFAGVALSVLVRLRSFAVPRGVAQREEMAHFFGFVGEQMAGREDIAAYGARGYALALLIDRLLEWRRLAVLAVMVFARMVHVLS